MTDQFDVLTALDEPATMAERNAATRINEALGAWARESSEANAQRLERALRDFNRSLGMTKRELYALIDADGVFPAFEFDEPDEPPLPPTRVTKRDAEAAIQDESYLRLGAKTTVCILTLQNGFEVVGSSACVDPANFDYATGKRLAREDAMRKVWTLEGYLLQDKQR
jgi:hypothetical protein